MTEIILIRHGETEWNASNIFRGRADVDLNETGLRQAEQLGEYLSSEEIDFIYTSPLKRAVRTAGAIARPQNIEVNTIENLIDFDFGEWQGLTLVEVQEKYPELYQDWLDTPEQVGMPGGESLASVRDRAMSFLQDAVMRCEEGKIAMVSHRVVLKVIICALLGLENSRFWNIKMDTGAITRFVFDGDRVILTEHNNTSYLKNMQGHKLNDF
jgi:broad specificity phosphatase PhoE